MDLGLTGKVALVTGASRGIGKAIALGLGAEGCRVALVARTREAVEAAAAEVAARGADALPIVADVSVAADVERMIDAAAARWGRLDVLVNNVGGRRGGAFMETTDEDWLGAFELNVLSAIRASRAAVPHLRQQGGGAIVMISSIYGREAGGVVTYNATKSAMISLTKNLARELAGENIRVNSVAPGSISFPGGSWWRRQQEDPQAMAEFVRRDMPYGRFGRVDEVANVAVFLASERASLMTGACVPVDGAQGRSNI
ncbi:MAG TPA: SDR family oxidoreductase [Chloroflexota bacterium]|nr:SDR family oxidoreductase [Chloroflexota bacterium]